MTTTPIRRVAVTRPASVQAPAQFQPSRPARAQVPAPVVEPLAFINKYRPGTFSHVMGQDVACKQVYDALDMHVHAFLFHGPAGVGKTSMARLVAQELDADVREVDSANAGGVSEIRELVAGLGYRALSGSGNRCVIIDECHKLSKDAWTALLKPLEEPESHVYFALCTTEPAKIPTTVRTRLASIELKPVSPVLLHKLLGQVVDTENMRIPDSGLQIIVNASGGSPRMALALLSTCHSATTDADVMVACAVAGESEPVIELARMLVSRRVTWPMVLDVLRDSEEPPESIRLMIVNYVAKVLLGTPDMKKAQGLLAVLDAFSTPCPPSEKMAPLLRSFGYVLLGA